MDDPAKVTRPAAVSNPKISPGNIGASLDAVRTRLSKGISIISIIATADTARGFSNS